MADLETDVQTRVSATRLLVITNFDSPNASSLNATRLAAASRDVEAAMQLHGGVKYDSTNPIHVDLAVDGVPLKLLLWGNNVTEGQRKDWEAWLKRVQTLRERETFLAESSGTQTPSVEDPNRYPRMDLSHFSGYTAVPNPRSTREEENT